MVNTNVVVKTRRNNPKVITENPSDMNDRRQIKTSARLLPIETRSDRFPTTWNSQKALRTSIYVSLGSAISFNVFNVCYELIML